MGIGSLNKCSYVILIFRGIWGTMNLKKDLYCLTAPDLGITERLAGLSAHSHSFPGDSQAFKTGFSCCRVHWVLGYLQPHGGGVGVVEPLF